MKDKQITMHGTIQVATISSTISENEFLAWGKIGFIVADDPIREPGEPVWFDWGTTREEATSRVLDDIARHFIQ